MKFLRYGDIGQEKPGLLHRDGTIRDLSGVIPDLAGEVLTRLSGLPDLDTGSVYVQGQITAYLQANKKPNHSRHS